MREGEEVERERIRDGRTMRNFTGDPLLARGGNRFERVNVWGKGGWLRSGAHVFVVFLSNAVSCCLSILSSMLKINLVSG